MFSVGEVLKKEREKRGLGLYQIEKVIKIREKFLKAVENNDWNTFSSRIYIEGIIKSYSRFLDFDDKKILAFFRREYAKKEEVRFKTKISSKYLTPETKKIVAFGFFLLFLFFFSYFSFQLKIYLSPPKIVIISPATNSFKHDDMIKIIGKTEKEAAITIFGERIYQNKDGIFEFNLPLRKGKNELTIEVVGANGKKSLLRKEFIRIQ